MLQIHSYWAYLVLLVLILAVGNSLLGLVKKKSFTDKDLRLALFTLILSHFQLLIGFVVYFNQGWHKNIGAMMSDSAGRLLALEHPLTMIIAIALITIGWSKHKKKTEDAAKFKTIFTFYAIALFLILLRIPWSNWFDF
ncbi:MAG: hypothetical protein CMB99_10210 [Flavobacteriaceae bacterium]|nr:hypothetical protein [Flavobacteriaceae bacterium]